MYEYKAIILEVTDGDTVKAHIDLGLRSYRTEPLRLFGINAPEKRGATKSKGEEAKAFLASLIEGKEVLIHTRKDKQEKYGRWLVDIYLGGLHINQHMIDNGHAVPYMTT